MGTGASKQAGGSHPPRAGDLQPDVRPRTTEVEALRDLHERGFAGSERVDADRATTRIAALMADQELVDGLRHTGFAGPRYEALKAALAGYGDPVMRAWIRRGQIFHLTAERGRPVQCPLDVREHLARDTDDRRELAMEVVANALVFFRERALVQRLWTPERGAVLTTFFVGSCVLTFANVFRAWLKEHLVDRQHRDIDTDRPRDRFEPDPADVVAAMETFCDMLNSAPTPTVRSMLATLVLEDQPYAEIARRHGTTEAAVKMALHRFRRSYAQEGMSNR